jgi:hypothetical protein
MFKNKKLSLKQDLIWSINKVKEMYREHKHCKICELPITKDKPTNIFERCLLNLGCAVIEVDLYYENSICKNCYTEYQKIKRYSDKKMKEKYKIIEELEK